MSNTPHAAPFTSPATIASAPLLPPRVRRILTTFFAHVSTDLGERINLMLLEFEQQLFKSAERARSNEKQAEQFANLHAMRKSRSDLLPMFLAGLEAELASIRDLRQKPLETHVRIEFQTLTLAPIQTDMLDLASLTRTEIDWLDAYHARVWSTLEARVSAGARAWLLASCRAVSLR